VVEAELKARVRDPARVQRLLDQRAAGEAATYADTYYDRPDEELYRTGRELRLRTVQTVNGVRHLLTYKAAAVDARSQSKPEQETEVAERTPVEAALHGLGFEVWVQFSKRVLNYRFVAAGRTVLASLVTVPELDGTFIEVETLAAPDEVGTALGLVRRVLGELEIGESDLTTERYDAAVRASGM
jgi:adenylate cyclase, class 2